MGRGVAVSSRAKRGIFSAGIDPRSRRSLASLGMTAPDAFPPPYRRIALSPYRPIVLLPRPSIPVPTLHLRHHPIERRLEIDPLAVGHADDDEQDVGHLHG